MLRRKLKEKKGGGGGGGGGGGSDIKMAIEGIHGLEYGVLPFCFHIRIDLNNPDTKTGI